MVLARTVVDFFTCMTKENLTSPFASTFSKFASLNIVKDHQRSQQQQQQQEVKEDEERLIFKAAECLIEFSLEKRIVENLLGLVGGQTEGRNVAELKEAMKKEFPPSQDDLEVVIIDETQQMFGEPLKPGGVAAQNNPQTDLTPIIMSRLKRPNNTQNDDLLSKRIYTRNSVYMVKVNAADQLIRMCKEKNDVNFSWKILTTFLPILEPLNPAKIESIGSIVLKSLQTAVDAVNTDQEQDLDLTSVEVVEKALESLNSALNLFRESNRAGGFAAQNLTSLAALTLLKADFFKSFGVLSVAMASQALSLMSALMDDLHLVSIAVALLQFEYV